MTIAGMTLKEVRTLRTLDAHPDVVAARDRVQAIRQRIADYETERQALDARRTLATTGEELRDIRERARDLPGAIIDARAEEKLAVKGVADACARVHEAAAPALAAAFDELLASAPEALAQVQNLTAELSGICALDSAFRVSIGSYGSRSALPPRIEDAVALLARVVSIFMTSVLPFSRREPVA
jgi:hypothetical protein